MSKSESREEKKNKQDRERAWGVKDEEGKENRRMGDRRVGEKRKNEWMGKGCGLRYDWRDGDECG